ncbi:MAG: metal ABC transporter substrate-binding protein [Thermacetogeniaceae bacterium]
MFKGTLLALGLFMLLAQLLVGGCKSTAVTGQTGQPKPTVIAASFYPMYIMTKNIAKDIPDVKVINMTRPTTGCLHDYQVTTDDLKNLEGANFFVINGAGMESFLDKVTAQMPNLKMVDASKGIALIKDESGDGNPHIWVSVSLAMQQVTNISEQLAALDPQHADAYRKNAAAYLAKLQALKDRMHQSLDSVKQRDIITFHEAFPYFAQEFNLHIVAVVEHEPGSEPSAGELAKTIAVVRQAGIKTVFAEPQYPAKAAETIARETGANISYLDPAVTGPDDLDAYIKTMDQNLVVLKEALGGQS